MKDLKERIKDGVTVEGECWTWRGATKGFGYGYLTTGSRKDGSRKTQTAHRVSYSVYVGPIPDGMWVLHHCDNPKCCNPKHLYIGDRKQNVSDMMTRGRLSSQKGESNNNAKINMDTANMIRIERKENRTSYREIAYMFGLKSHKTVMQICNGELWVPEPPK